MRHIAYRIVLLCMGTQRWTGPAAGAQAVEYLAPREPVVMPVVMPVKNNFIFSDVVLSYFGGSFMWRPGYFEVAVCPKAQRIADVTSGSWSILS